MTAHMQGWRRALRKAVLPMLALLVVVGVLQVPRLMQGAPAAIGGPFTLIDQQGRTVTDADFRGRLMLIYFGYSFCPDLCPTTLSQMVHVYGLLTPAEQAQLVPIFVTVDPARDTVPHMAEYVASFSPALIGLTGSQRQIDDVTKAYRVYAKKSGDGPNYGVDHSSILYLMGKDGRFLRHFEATATDQTLKDGISQAIAH